MYSFDVECLTVLIHFLIKALTVMPTVNGMNFAQHFQMQILALKSQTHTPVSFICTKSLCVTCTNLSKRRYTAR